LFHESIIANLRKIVKQNLTKIAARARVKPKWPGRRTQLPWHSPI
jgi:hypothetical protein